jgi:hypothetical protein
MNYGGLCYGITVLLDVLVLKIVNNTYTFNL